MNPSSVDELAASCVDYVKRAMGVELDFTSDTLPLLDHYLQDAGRTAQGHRDALELIAQTAGAYFGGVLQRRFDCWWVKEGEPSSWVLRFREVYLEICPHALIVAALGLPIPQDAPEVGFLIDPDDVEFISAYLAASPPVSEEEFIRMTTRYDVLETVVDQLKARAIARNLGDVLFENPDYEE